MIGGAPPEIDIYCARESVVGMFNRVKRLAGKIDRGAWKSFYAGAMFMFNKQLDEQLGRFGVEVNDD